MHHLTRLLLVVLVAIAALSALANANCLFRGTEYSAGALVRVAKETGTLFQRCVHITYNNRTRFEWVEVLRSH